MSVRQILKANEIIAVVPDARKAPAVKLCLEEKSVHGAGIYFANASGCHGLPRHRIRQFA